MPKNPENHELIQVDGVDVYYPASLAAEFKTVRVVLQRFLFLNSLLADGEQRYA